MSGRGDVAALGLQVTFGDVAVAEERAVEIQRIRRGLVDGLSCGVGNVHVSLDDQVVGRNPITMSLELAGIEPNDVLAYSAVCTRTRRDRDIVLSRPFNCLLTGRYRYPDRRVRLLDGPRPERD